MNKFFTKIAGLTLGLAMAIGVGVAAGGRDAAKVVNAGSATFTLVESSKSDWSGTYVVVATVSATNYMFNGAVSSDNLDTTSNALSSGFTINNKTLTTDLSNAITVTSSSSTGKYKVSTSGGLYFGKNANSNGFDKGTSYSTNYDNAFSFNSTTKVVSMSGNGGRCLACLNSKFRYYASSNVNIKLYELQSSGPTKLNEPEKPTYNSNTQQLTWSAVSNASSYEYTTNGGSTWTAVTDSTNRYHDVSGWTDNTSYTVALRAVGDVTNYSTSDAGTALTFTKVGTPTYTEVTVTGGDLQGDTKGSAYIQCSASAKGTNLPASPSFTWYVTETNTYGTSTSVTNKASIDNTGKVIFLDDATVYVWALAPDGTTHNLTGYAASASNLKDPEGSINNPYSVSQALALCNELSAGTNNGESVYVIGIVSAVGGSVSSKATSPVTFTIQDLDDDSVTLMAFSIQNGSTTDTGHQNYVAVGYEVKIFGYLIDYNGTKEVGFVSGYSNSSGFVYSHSPSVDPEPSVSITENSFTMDVEDDPATLHATLENCEDVDGGEENITINWESSETSYVSLSSATGSTTTATAVAAGQATVTASITVEVGGVEKTSQASIIITVISSPIHTGDEIYFYAEYSNSTYYMCSVGGTSSSSTTESQKIMFTVESGSDAGTYSFKHGTNYLKGTTSSPYLGSGTDKDSSTSWTIVDNGNDVIITNSSTSRKLMWNYNNGTHRFGAYNSTSASILYVSIGFAATPTYVTLNKTELTLENGASETLTYTTDQYVTFTWISSDSNVATVDSNGLVECVASYGNTTITVFFDANGDGIKDKDETVASSCLVTATAPSIDFGAANYGGIATLIESTTGLDGKKVIFGRNAVPAVSGSLSGSYLTSVNNDSNIGGVSYNSTTKKMTIGNGRSETGVTVFTITQVTNGYTFSTVINNETKYLTESSAKNINLSDTEEVWTISISSGTATITSDGSNKLQYNTSNPRFTTYSSSQASIELYEFKSYYEEATEYANYFLEGDTGTCAETISDWSDLADMFDGLTTGAQNIYKIATHNDPSTYSHEISVEHAVARYDEALLKHPELRDYEFMGRVAEGTLSLRITSLIAITKNTSATIVIVIISAISVAAIGGYFLFRKKKED